MLRTRRLTLTAATCAALAACATTDDGGASVATATLAKADGTPVGAAVAMQRPDGRIELVVTLRGLSPGKHGVHVHTTGACQPTFAAAGGHWNPGSATHGLEGTDGQHAGDMPNVDVGANGTGSLTYALAPSATLAGLLDADGSAFIVHAGEDDQRTDPSGNSGDRLACGVFVAR